MPQPTSNRSLENVVNLALSVRIVSLIVLLKRHSFIEVTSNLIGMTFMCFGPIASFSSAVVLTTIGTATIKKIRRKKDLLFASLPLLFGAHQMAEGFLWLSFRNNTLANYRSFFTLIFLVVAFFFWPFYVPLSIYLLEDNKQRKRLILVLVFLGLCLGSYLLLSFLSETWAASVVNCSIYYHFTIPGHEVLLALLYLAVTFGPFLISSRKSVNHLGILNIIFCAIAAYIYYTDFISVWCFFAAVLSTMIFLFFAHPTDNAAHLASVPIKK